ncbi:hypothetical protein P0Y43_10345 [Pseudomonas entomophila]|uniref:hypothetical protein n=1 Tax=Pseudomonas entomophila TaxID=312306 RepID=UPI0023D822B7|nr:hypothetical protein [Pseudomonas entomophila]MDF0731123.1 hypothetical protein [Pseudomonas entomophila]
MTILVQKKGSSHLHLASARILELKAPRLLGVLPLLDDEQGVYTRPLAAQVQPLRFEVDVWDGYEEDYRTLIESGFVNPRVVFQVVRDGQHIGLPVIRAMTADPAELFPVELQLPAPSPLRDREFAISYDQWIEEIENGVRSAPSQVYYDRTAPNENSPFGLSGPSLIDREHLDANGGFARFELPRWPDLRLEDRVLLFFRREGEAPPATPLIVVDIDQANRDLPIIPLLIAESLLMKGRFEVSCQLQDRAGNVNRGSNLLDVTVDLVGGELPPIERIEPDFVSFFGWINCASLERATREPWPDPGIPRGMRFRVPLPLEGVSVGDPVQLIWQMCRDLHGEDPISDASLLPAEPLRADGLVVMPSINELIVKEFEKVFQPGVDAFEGSVRVIYRVRTQAGPWRPSSVEVIKVSLQQPGGRVCSGPWMTT